MYLQSTNSTLKNTKKMETNVQRIKLTKGPGEVESFLKWEQH
jgi:hypothetical protein